MHRKCMNVKYFISGTDEKLLVKVEFHPILHPEVKYLAEISGINFTFRRLHVSEMKGHNTECH